MEKSSANKSNSGKQATSQRSRPATTGPRAAHTDFSGLQRAAGNQAVTRLIESNATHLADPRAELLTQAGSEPGSPMDSGLRHTLEKKLGTNLGNVRVHSGAGSAAAAESIGARAYTIGTDIHLGAAARQLGGDERSRLLTHEAVHTVQQGGKPVPLAGALPVSRPGDSSETEARSIANSEARPGERTQSRALAMRDAMRVTPVGPGIQRDIGPNWTKEFALGKLEIHFKRKDATAPGGTAVEEGDIKFTPDERSPDAEKIRFIQIGRTFNVAAGRELDWSKGPEATRNKIRTAQDTARNITGGFYIDQFHAGRAPRAKKADPEMLPFYDITAPGTIGKKKGTTIVPATLRDNPHTDRALKFNFVTVAKGDPGIVYGVVLWGFETFLDTTGVLKIKNEYVTFRRFQGETFDAAIQKFNEFYKNPGTPGAPTT